MVASLQENLFLPEMVNNPAPEEFRADRDRVDSMVNQLERPGDRFVDHINKIYSAHEKLLGVLLLCDGHLTFVQPMRGDIERPLATLLKMRAFDLKPPTNFDVPAATLLLSRCQRVLLRYFVAQAVSQLHDTAEADDVLFYIFHHCFPVLKLGDRVLNPRLMMHGQPLLLRTAQFYLVKCEPAFFKLCQEPGSVNLLSVLETERFMGRTMRICIDSLHDQAVSMPIDSVNLRSLGGPEHSSTAVFPSHVATRISTIADQVTNDTQLPSGLRYYIRVRLHRQTQEIAAGYRLTIRQNADGSVPFARSIFTEADCLRVLQLPERVRRAMVASGVGVCSFSAIYSRWIEYFVMSQMPFLPRELESGTHSGCAARTQQLDAQRKLRELCDGLSLFPANLRTMATRVRGLMDMVISNTARFAYATDPVALPPVLQRHIEDMAWARGPHLLEYVQRYDSSHLKRRPMHRIEMICAVVVDTEGGTGLAPAIPSEGSLEPAIALDVLPNTLRQLAVSGDRITKAAREVNQSIIKIYEYVCQEEADTFKDRVRTEQPGAELYGGNRDLSMDLRIDALLRHALAAMDPAGGPVAVDVRPSDDLVAFLESGVFPGVGTPAQIACVSQHIARYPEEYLERLDRTATNARAFEVLLDAAILSKHERERVAAADALALRGVVRADNPYISRLLQVYRPRVAALPGTDPDDPTGRKLFLNTPVTLEYYERVRRACEYAGVDVCPLPPAVTHETRFFPPTDVPVFPDVALRIDCGVFGDTLVLQPDWPTRLVNLTPPVPRDITDHAYHATEPAVYRAPGACRAVAICRTRAADNTGRHQLRVERITAIEFPAVSRNRAPLARAPNAVASATDTVIWTAPPFVSPPIRRLGYELDRSYTTAYALARRAIWRAGDCFRPATTAPDGIKAFVSPSGVYIYHGAPLPWLSADYLRQWVAASDLHELNWAFYFVWTQLTSNYQYGPGPAHAMPLAFRYLHEHPVYAGVVSDDGTTNVFTPIHRAERFTLTVMEAVAARYSRLIHLYSENGVFRVPGVRQKPFAERMPGRATIACVHEQLVTKGGRRSPLTIHIMRASIRPGPDVMDAAAAQEMADRVFDGRDPQEVVDELWQPGEDGPAIGTPPQRDVIGEYMQRVNKVHRNIRDEAQRTKSGLAFSEGMDYDLCNSYAILEFLALLRHCGARFSRYMVFEPLVSTFKGVDLVLTFPEIHLSAESEQVLDFVLRNRTWAPFTKMRVVPPPPEDELISVYPLRVPHSAHLFVARGIYNADHDVSREARVQHSHFLLPRLEQANLAASALDQVRQPSIRTFFANPVDTSLQNNIHLLAMLFGHSEGIMIASFQARTTGVQQLRLDRYVAQFGHDPGRFADVANMLTPCEQRPASCHAGCGCGMTTLAMYIRCKLKLLEQLEMIDIVAIGIQGYRAIVKGLSETVRPDETQKAVPIFTDADLFAITEAILRHARIRGASWATNASPWSTHLASSLRDDEDLRYFTTKSLSLMARRDSPARFAAWQNEVARIFLEAQGARGIEMSSVVCEVASFFLRLDYATVRMNENANFKPIRFRGTYWDEHLQPMEGLWMMAKTLVEPLLTSMHDDAIQARADALDVADGDEPPTDAQMAPLNKAVTCWEVALSTLRNVRGQTTVERVIARDLEFPEYVQARNHCPRWTATLSRVLEALPDGEHGPSDKRIGMPPTRPSENAELPEDTRPTLACGTVQEIDGMPEHWITINTGYHLDTRYDWDHQDVKMILEAMDMMFCDYTLPKDRQREMVFYILQDMARGLYGINTEKKIRVFYGPRGDNAKSTLIKLIQETFGAYSDVCQSNIFTTRARDAGSASPQLAKLAFIRWAFCGELDEKDEFSGSLLKKVTSNDAYEARKLFENPMIIKPVTRFGIHSNEKPSIRTGGPVAIRRFIIFLCESRFNSSAPQGLEAQRFARHYPADPTAELRLCRAKGALMWIFQQLYPGKVFSDIPATEEQKRIYYREVDRYQRFIASELEMQDSTGNARPLAISARDMYDRFIAFLRSTGDHGSLSQDEFQRGMEAADAVPYVRGFYEYVKFVNREDQAREEMEDYFRSRTARFGEGAEEMLYRTTIQTSAQERAANADAAANRQRPNAPNGLNGGGPNGHNP